MRWRSWLTPLLKDGTNIVFAGDSFEQLPAKYREVAARPAAAAAMASATAHFFHRLLHPAGVSCYFQELIRRYAGLLQYDVAPPDGSYVSVDTAVLNALRAHGIRDTAIEW
jgi:hypothetical protein